MKDATGPATWSSKGPTWDGSQASLPVSVAATISPVSASVPMCSVRRAPRVLVLCLALVHECPDSLAWQEG